MKEQHKYSVIQKDGLNFIHLYFLSYNFEVRHPRCVIQNIIKWSKKISQNTTKGMLAKMSG